jgi:hypothetical protein
VEIETTRSKNRCPTSRTALPPFSIPETADRSSVECENPCSISRGMCSIVCSKSWKTSMAVGWDDAGDCRRSWPGMRRWMDDVRMMRPPSPIEAATRRQGREIPDEILRLERAVDSRVRGKRCLKLLSSPAGFKACMVGWLQWGHGCSIS